MPARTLLVPLDGSLRATAALPVARGLAALCEAMLTVLHVTDDELAPAALLERVRLSADDARGLVVDRRAGEPAAAIAREAAERGASFVVMCPRVREDGERRTLGSVAEAVLASVTCPVVLVPPDRGRRSWALGRVLFPHDGTPTSAAALGPVAALAARASAEVVVLHVATPGAGPPGEAGALACPRYLDHPHHEWPAWQHEFLDRLCALGGATPRPRLRLALVGGEPGPAIVDFARESESDLVVLAWRGALEAGRARAMRHVIRDAGCPVAVFRVPAP